MAQILDKDTKFAHLGKPGTAFSPGFERRLQLLIKQVDLTDKKILDMGCGEGVWMHEFTRFTKPANIYGEDIDPESISKFQILNSKFKKDEQIPDTNLVVAPTESLPFEDNTFDIVFSNEVLEHVEDDRKSVEEVVRVLKPGGKFVVFTPNRGWPFETHGMFRNGKYIWGNIFLLPWAPKSIYEKYAPHVRNYWNGDIKNLFANLDGKIAYHSHVFPAFDKLSKRYFGIGKLVQKFFHLIEKTPLHWFGISHFIIFEKKS